MDQASRPSITDAAKITRLIRMRPIMTNGLLIADRTASYNQPLAVGSGLRMPTGCHMLLGRDGTGRDDTSAGDEIKTI